nr:alpha-amylase family glycosyl hydrolase [uncultured Lachnoclostridium sp.]
MEITMWYQRTVFYEIYVPSFCDSNGDGIGDLQGIISKIPYLSELGIKGIWLTPFYPSPRVDNGYDISNYYDVDKTFGTMEDFKHLLERAHEYGIRVIIDVVINHTSNQHPWFLESKKSKENTYRDYYIWEEKPKNNWESFFAGSAWEYEKETNEYYYHAFSKEQVCLNYSNPRVKEEIIQVLKFWLDLGVDGFRFDVINFLKMQRDKWPDNPYENGKQLHKYDKNQPGILKFIEELKSFVSNWNDKFLLGEIGEDYLEDMLPYVGKEKLDACFNFNIGSIENFDLKKIYEELVKCEKHQIVPTLFFSTHDMKRHFSRLCKEQINHAKLLAFMMLTLKGIPFLYQGEEIPTKDFRPKSIEEIQDIQGRLWYNNAIKQGFNKEEAFALAYQNTRDFSRSLLEWKDEDLNEDFYQFYQTMIAFRNENEILQTGNYDFIALEDFVLSYRRTSGNQSITFYLNFGETEVLLPKGYQKVLGTQEESEVLKPMNAVALCLGKDESLKL